MSIEGGEGMRTCGLIIWSYPHQLQVLIFPLGGKAYSLCVVALGSLSLGETDQETCLSRVGPFWVVHSVFQQCSGEEVLSSIL